MHSRHLRSMRRSISRRWDESGGAGRARAQAVGALHVKRADGRSNYPRSREGFELIATALGERHRHETFVGMSPVRVGKAVGLLPCHVLWAVVANGDGVRKLERFRPRPTLVLAEGDTFRRTAVWALARPLTWDWTVRGNRRLAHWFGGPKRFAQPDHMMRAPASYVRHGRVVPVPITVIEQNDDALYLPADVVRHLRDAPEPDAWRRRQEVAA
jgi:hypothetical protein